MRRRHRIIKNFRKAQEHRSIAMQVLDLVAHKLNLNTHWEDYYRFGLYRQDMPWSEKALYVSDYGSYHSPVSCSIKSVREYSILIESSGGGHG